ncbi:hypothetical protein UFOVP1236_45 [uncultured Caudovirales phage]|uniref:Uncharacterized protein n=1 Tax=uncultured Caudovirales phage TaxID=2100421 RepID=A0A6J5RFX8_9CAUD|nr:hypothetical protein UFOVP1236_45 [uncultured Caudovirales phage]
MAGGGTWTTPKTWTAAIVSVADMLTHVRDNLNALTQAATTITTTGTQTALTLPVGRGDLVIFANNATLLTIQGVTAAYDGQRLTIFSKGAGQVDINNEHASASAANRIITGSSGTISLPAGSGRASMIYDVTTTRWRLDEASASVAGIPQGRLTLTTAVPVTTADVTAAVTVRWTPFRGNTCAVYNGTAWLLRTFTELSIAVPGVASSLYDVFVYDNAGTLALELSSAWTSDTARFASGAYATLVPQQDGVYVKSTNGTVIDATRRYLGTFRTTTVAGQTEDSATKRYVWNYYQRVVRPMLRFETTASWVYASGTLRQANASTSNQLDVVVGVAEVLVDIRAQTLASASGTDVTYQSFISIGEDSTTTKSASSFRSQATGVLLNAQVLHSVSLRKIVDVGRHYYTWLEQGAASGSITWIGASTYGLTGSIEN